MATITITIPTTQTARVIDGICYANTYQDIIDGQPNPETKTAFSKRMVVEYILNCIKQYEIIVAVEAARKNVNLSVDTNITLT